MKKFVAALLIAAITLFCGFGCGELSELNCFSVNAWNGGGEGLASSGVKETLVYDVSFSEDFNNDGFNFIRSKGIYSGLDCEITGTYTVNLSVIEKIDSSVTFESDLLSESTTLIRVSTDLDLTAVYKYDGKVETKKDSIKDLYYILQGDKAYAPIYTERTFDYNLVSAFNTVKFSENKGKTSTLYNKKEYTLKTELYDPLTGETTSNDTRTNSYDFKTLISSEELLFALRNVNLEKGKSITIPAESFVYNGYSKLSVECFNDSAEISLDGLNYNGTKKDVKLAAKGYGYKINATQSGRAQLVYIQSAAKDIVANRSLMVKYVQPLAEYGNQLCMGAMIYTLSSVSVA